MVDTRGTLPWRHVGAAALALAMAQWLPGTAQSGDGDAAQAATHESPPEAPGASGPLDADLELNATCKGHPSASALTARLPSYARELVLLWPRTGRRTHDGGCVTVSRLTTFNHQGTPLTLSFLLHAGAAAQPARDYRRLEDDELPRAVLEVLPHEDHPDVLVEVAGSPSTSRDTLESVLDFVDARAAVEGLVGNGDSGKVRDP